MLPYIAEFLGNDAADHSWRRRGCERERSINPA